MMDRCVGSVCGVVGVLATAAGAWIAAPVQAAVVSWTGAGDGVNWSNPANWSGGVLPGPADDVVLNVAGTPTVVIAGVSPTVRSIATAEVLRIDTGATVTTDTATCRAAILLAGGTISGGRWTMTNSATVQVQTGTSTIDGAEIVGDVLHGRLQGRLRITGSAAVTRIRIREDQCGLLFSPGYVINFPIVMEDEFGTDSFGIDSTASGTLTLGTSGSISGGWQGRLVVGSGSTTTHFVNRGVITTSGTNRTLVMSGVRFTNAPEGVINVSGGSTIQPEVAGSEPGSWTNEGTINASGSTITLRGPWANLGTIRATNCVVNLQTSFTSDAARTIERVGGSLNIQGVMDNRGRSIVLDSTTGSWRLDGGTILGGTLSWVAPQRLEFSSVTTSLLDSVAFPQELILNQANTAFTIAGAAPMAGIRVTLPGATLRYADGAVINYPIVANSASAGLVWVRAAVNGGAFTIGPQGSITTAPGSQASIRVGDGSGSTNDPATGRLTNHGRIESGTLGNTLRVRAGLVQNTGMIRAGSGVQGEIIGLSGEAGRFDVGGVNSRLTLNGNYTLRGTSTVGAGGLLRLNGSWRTEGTVAVAGGTLELAGTFPAIRPGSITNAGGNVTIVGTLNNNGTVVLDSTTGSWGVSGGIVGGSVVQSEGSRIVPIGSPAFLDVAIGGELLVSNANARPRIEGSTRAGSYRVTGSGAGLFFTPGHMLREEVVFEGDAPGRGIETSGQNGVLTISPEGRIRVLGGSVDIGARHSNASGRVIDLQGVIEAVGPGSTAVINSPILANLDSASGRLVGGTWRALQGGSISFNNRPVRVNAATIELDGEGTTPGDLVTLESNEGTLRLSGGRDLDVLTRTEDADLFTNTGRLEVGAGSVFRVGSDLNAAGFAQPAAGITRFTLGGTDPTQHARVSALGTATLDGIAEVVTADGFALACGQGFDVLAAALIAGRYASLDVATISDGSRLIAVYGGTGVRFVATPAGDFNRDGFVDTFDYLEFVACFEGGCEPGRNADFNQDGFIDFFDFDAFAAAFETGC